MNVSSRRQFAEPETEAALLGWLVTHDPGRAGTLRLTRHDFTSREADELFEVMLALGGAGNFSSICSELRQRGWPRPGSMLAAYVEVADDLYVGSPIPLARRLRELSCWRVWRLRLEAATAILNDASRTIADLEACLGRAMAPTQFKVDDATRVARFAAQQHLATLPRRRVLRCTRESV